MLRWRLLGAAAIIVPVLVLLWMDDCRNAGRPGIWFAPLIFCFALVCCAELAFLFRQSVANLSPTLLIVAGALAMGIPTIFLFWKPPGLSGVSSDSWAWIGLALAVGVVTLSELSRFQVGRDATARLGLLVLAVVYIAIPYHFLINLRMLFPNRLGLMAFVSVVYVAKFADAGAYFTGRFLGKHAMAPILSPKKTIEGALGGAGVALAATVAYFRGIVPALYPDASEANLVAVLGFAITITIAGMFGDLSVSLWKRDTGQKDSAKLLPGLGGSLDILDSVLWAAPIGYLWWVSGLLGGP